MSAPATRIDHGAPAGPGRPAGARIRRLAPRFVRDLPYYTLGLLVAYALKSFYSRAGAADLSWILGPTCLLVDLATGISFDFETGQGWINHPHRMIVGPSCAGLNFLIILFSTLYFSSLHRVDGLRRKLAWFGVSLGAAFLFTIGTNSLRIIAAIHLYAIDIYGGWITPERVHRIAGTLVYCFSLFTAHLTVDRIAGVFLLGSARSSAERARLAPALRSALAPFSWYLLVALAVPLLNGAFAGDRAQLAEHSLVVLSIALAFLVLFCAVNLGVERASRKRGQRRGMVGNVETVQPKPALRPTWRCSTPGDLKWGEQYTATIRTRAVPSRTFGQSRCRDG